MRSLGGLAALACVALAGCGGEESKPQARQDRCERYCVTVQPPRGDTRTVFRFEGRGWVPRRAVTATYGVYCPPRRVCILIAKTTRFRTGPGGEFVFHFRNGPEPLSDAPPPRAAGGGPVSFRQRAGPSGSTRYVSRRPAYRVEGRLVGGNKR